jgi:16S rRNA (guanine527-N7)-methyltransferase
VEASGRLVEGAEALGLDLGADQLDRLERFVQLLAERALPLGLVARGDSGRILERHVLDGLRAVPVLLEAGADHVVDLGSGAGLPGIPVAIAIPGAGVTLTESRSRRAAFLELAVRELGLGNTDVHAGRAQDLSSTVAACTARAFAPPARTWEVARSLLRPGGFLLLFAGATFGADGPFQGGAARVWRGTAGGARGVSGRRVRPEWLESAGPLVMITRT